MDKPLVSIIIPTYNRAHLIGETLDSVLAQTYTNWECIVVDDGSTDNTDEVLKNYCEKDARFKYVHRPNTHKPGGNGARNYGFELSKGDYIQWFDSDDIMLDDFIINKLRAFNENYLFVICSGYMWSLDEKIEIPTVLAPGKNLFVEYCLWRAHILTPSVLFLKSYLNDKKLFDENIYRGQETELFARLFFETKKEHFEIIEEKLFLYRQHCQTKTFENSKYNPLFKESQAYIYVENFKRAISINNLSLSRYVYKKIIKMLFLALRNNHVQNTRYLQKELKSILYKNNKFFYIKLCFFVGLLKIHSTRLENHFKYLKLNFNE